MPAALFILIGCELVGTVLQAALHLPIPGPVIGMFLLTAALASRGRRTSVDDTPADRDAPSALERTSDALIAYMGLLFVPAGVGVIAEAGLFRQQWLPITAALLGSTLLSLLVTGLVMHRVTRFSESRKALPPSGMRVRP